MPSLINAIQGRNAALNAGQEISDTGINVAHSLEKATQGGISAVQGGMAGAQSAIDTGLSDANTTLGNIYDQNGAYVRPYQQAGEQGVNQLAQFAAGEGSQPFQFDPSKDPGFQFRMQQAAKTMANQASARGGVQGGGYAKSLGSYLQNVASSEYQNAFTRDLQTKQFKQGMLSDLAGIGERANTQAIQSGEFYAGQKSSNDMTAGGEKANIINRGGEYIADLGLRGAAAAGSQYDLAAQGRAAGDLGAANAWSGYLNDVNKALMLAAMGG